MLPVTLNLDLHKYTIFTGLNLHMPYATFHYQRNSDNSFKIMASPL